MKKYLLLFLLLIPFVSANMPAPSSVYNVYLDGTLLDNFRISAAECLPLEATQITNLNKSDLAFIEYDKQRDCTWIIMKSYVVCNTNPCHMYSFIERLYLETGNVSILTEKINDTKLGQYDLFIHSDGTVELNFLKEVDRYQDSNRYAAAFAFGILLALLPFLILNAAIEVGVAFLYFKKRRVPYNKLWQVVAANIVTYVPFMIVMGRLDILSIIIAEIIIIIFEALYYKWTIKELQWNNVFILSLIANIVTIIIGVIIRSVLF